MMNAKPFLVIAYHLSFATLSMTLVTAIEGYGTEMFAGAFYFNLIYLVVGGIVNYLLYVILQRFFFNRKRNLIIAHWSGCLVLMNFLSFFLNSTCITWTLIIGIFVNKDDRFWVAFIVHVLMILCYLIAVFITSRVMQKIIPIDSNKVDH